MTEFKPFGTEDIARAVEEGREAERQRIVALFKDEHGPMSETLDYFVDGYYGWDNAATAIIEQIEGKPQ